MLPKWGLHFLLLIMLLMNSFNVSFAQNEKIQQFDSQIIVNPDASIDVTENISIYANNVKIIHGIVRHLPINLKISYGILHQTHYKIGSILLNGQPVDYHVNYSDNHLDIYIGNGDTTILPGKYLYTIHYHVDDAINFLKDSDELYWNITGNDWDFPIDRASADIILPQNAIIGLSSGYTGYTGAKDQHFTASKIGANRIIFTTNQALTPNAGLTVKILWQKGVIHQPSFTESIRRQFTQSEKIISLIMLISFAYYLLAWLMVGSDPDKDTIIPLFKPPAAVSAAAANYILKMGDSTQLFAISIISLAAKGYLQIVNNSGYFSLIKTTSDKQETLSEDEKVVFDTLFQTETTVSIDRSQQMKLKNASNKLKSSLANQFKNVYFHVNRIYLFPGILLGLAALGIAIYSSEQTQAAIFITVWLSLWSLVWFSLICITINYIHNAFSNPTISNIIRALFYSCISLVILIMGIIGLFIASAVIPMLTILFLTLIIIMNMSFSVFLKAPTKEGRKIMDQIEGFKRFLSTTERYRLQEMHAPPSSQELYERYLAYAIALDVNSAWGAQFSQSLVEVGRHSGQYHPLWYTGNIHGFASPALLIGTLNKNFISAINTANMPASSSGSGGGGFSGGGGGGGGGGGW